MIEKKLIYKQIKRRNLIVDACTQSFMSRVGCGKKGPILYSLLFDLCNNPWKDIDSLSMRLRGLRHELAFKRFGELQKINLYSIYE